MKFLTIIILAALSTASFSSMKCDLNVKVDEYEGGKIELKQFSYTQKDIEALSDQAEKEAAIKNALIKCENSKATECKIIGSSYNSSAPYPFALEEYTGHTAVAEGKILIGAKKLSDEQIAKKRQHLFCSKINECINDALNDENSSETYLNKLIQVKENRNCQQLESFIF